MEKVCKKCGANRFWEEPSKSICKLCGTEIAIKTNIEDAGKTIPCAAPPPAKIAASSTYGKNVPIPCEHGYYRSCCICHLNLSKDDIEELEKAIDTIFGLCTKYNLDKPNVRFPGKLRFYCPKDV